MYRLNILLFYLLDGHKAHRRPAGSLDDRLRVIGIVLVRLHEGLYKLRVDQFYRMATSLKHSCLVIGSAT